MIWVDELAETEAGTQIRKDKADSILTGVTPQTKARAHHANHNYHLDQMPQPSRRSRITHQQPTGQDQSTKMNYEEPRLEYVRAQCPGKRNCSHSSGGEPGKRLDKGDRYQRQERKDKLIAIPPRLAMNPAL